MDNDLKKYNTENFEEAQKFNEEEFKKGNF